MSAMQRAHRRDQSDNAVLRARLPRLLLHPRNRANDFTESVRGPKLRARRRSVLAIEVHQVRRDPAAHRVAATAW